MTTQVIGYSDEERAQSERIDAKLETLNAALAEREAALTSPEAIKILRAIRDHLPLVGPALGLLGAGDEHRSKAADAAKLITDVLGFVGI